MYPSTPTANAEPDAVAAWRDWRDSEFSADKADAMLKALTPTIDSVVRAYGGGSTLRSQAKLKSLEAMRKYQPDRSSPRTYLQRQLHSLARPAYQMTSGVRVPERQLLDRKRLSQAESDLENEFGRPPSDGELSARLGLSSRRIQHIRRLRPAVSESRTLATDDEGSVSSPRVIHPVSDRIWEDFVYMELSPIDQVVFDMAKGRNGRRPVPARDIARALKVSPGRISQRMQAIEQRLNYLRDTQPLGG